MRYSWKPYCHEDAYLVDSWLDEAAISGTGLDDGWQNFFDYWMTQSQAGEGKDCCFLIAHDSIPFAVMYIAITGNEIGISEYIVAPRMRGRGYGTAAIEDLLGNTARLLNTNASIAKAAVFPDNIASIRAFEKAGFVLASKNHDECGDSLNYEYRFS